MRLRRFFEENNPHALEEIARRLLEAEQRGLWDADEEVLENLKNHYLDIESWMEDQIGEGGYQGGSVGRVYPGRYYRVGRIDEGYHEKSPGKASQVRYKDMDIPCEVR